MVGLVDADYQVEPHWLRETVGYLEDPAVGFVQAPHAYRDFSHSAFGRAANAEYEVFFASGMRAMDHHGAGITVGTMSVIRAPRWPRPVAGASGALTEDSELAIRLHAAGYTSHYTDRANGRGLIPETFAAYRKQRHR